MVCKLVKEGTFSPRVPHGRRVSILTFIRVGAGSGASVLYRFCRRIFD